MKGFLDSLMEIEWMIFELLIVAIVIGIIVQGVRLFFKTKYIICDCGNRCIVNPDPCINWECDKCGANGRTPPI